MPQLKPNNLSKLDLQELNKTKKTLLDKRIQVAEKLVLEFDQLAKEWSRALRELRDLRDASEDLEAIKLQTNKAQGDSFEPENR